MSTRNCGAVEVHLTKNEVNRDNYHGLINLDRCSVTSQCSFTFDEVADLEPFNCVEDIRRSSAEKSNQVDPSDSYTKIITDFTNQFIHQVTSNLGYAIASGKFIYGGSFYGRGENTDYFISLTCNTKGPSFLVYRSILSPDALFVGRPVYGFLNISSEDGGSLAGEVSIACGILAFKELYDGVYVDMAPAINAVKELFKF